MQRASDSPLLVTRTAPDLIALKLNRPNTRNTLNVDLLKRLIRSLQSHPQRVAWIAGHGAAFCSGLDLREIRVRRTARRHLELLIDLYETLTNHPAPVVTIITGPARGGGAALAWCSDLAIASRTSDFAIPWIAGYRPLARVLLPLIDARRNVNRRALSLGETFTAAQAHRFGLIDVVFRGAPPTKAAVRSMLARRGTSADSTLPPRVGPEVFGEMRRLAQRASTPQSRSALLNYLNRRFEPS